MKRLPLGVLLAPLVTILFWAWAISFGHISTKGTFGAGLAIAGVIFTGILYVATLTVLVPLVLLLERYGRLSFWWVVAASTVIGIGWRIPLDIYFLGVREAVQTVLKYGARDYLWDAIYAFVLASAFCLIAGVPFRRKIVEGENDSPA
jgi:hypothetical protein